ncbi:uncharacterized protein EI90DRAFT_1645019 [Cantharellus anzutake]|uniref:uncharacterized protein n=1 Tax=Cantharellus anzutake TaxID=1750568 RepID=UPI0019042DEB|nr:uncharacterized protein EI90DRAFT_1645019 [Cantharellus anzutake]KAF8327919.1 hypothetical protein EI90DRAFT_1645019 [Cantharellus anzutake]
MMKHASTTSSSDPNNPPHYFNRHDPGRRPRPVDLPSPMSVPRGGLADLNPSTLEDDDWGLSSLLGVKPSSPVHISARARKRLGRLQLLSVFGALFLICLWFYWRHPASIAVTFPDGFVIPQDFRPNPTRYVQQRHVTHLPTNLPQYTFTSLTSWANGSFEIIAAEKGDESITFEVLTESATIQTSDLLKFDDSKAQDQGVVVVKLLDRVIPPKMSKWVKLVRFWSPKS